MATSAISAFSPVSGGSIVSSLLFTAAFHRSFFFPVNLARALAPAHSPFKHIHKHLNCNAASRNFSCSSTATADFSTNVSIPTSNNRYLTISRLFFLSNLMSSGKKKTYWSIITTLITSLIVQLIFCYYYMSFPNPLF